MMTEKLAVRVAAEKDRWAELKRRWGELGLPGSEYSPGDFLTCLLLAQAGTGVEELAGRVRAAADTFAALRRDSRLSSVLFGSDATTICALVLIDGADGAVETALAPPDVAPQEELTHCPHCAHRFDECAAGAYAEQVIGDGPDEPLAADTAPPAEQVTECPHCGHGFAACEAGEYAATAVDAPAEVAAPPSADKARPATAAETCIHVGSDSKCAACTADETVECSNCDCEQQLVAAKAHCCKNADCDAVFCDECAGDNLSEHGYCDDCCTTTCDGCQEDMEAGTERHCANESCPKKGDDFCDECVGRLLTDEGRCSQCAGEEDVQCVSCEFYFLASRTEKCRGTDCEQIYCADCRPKGLDRGGFCEICSA